MQVKAISQWLISVVHENLDARNTILHAIYFSLVNHLFNSILYRGYLDIFTGEIRIKQMIYACILVIQLSKTAYCINDVGLFDKKFVLFFCFLNSFSDFCLAIALFQLRVIILLILIQWHN